LIKRPARSEGAFSLQLDPGDRMVQVTQYLTAAVFVVLTGVICWRWARDRGAAGTSGWAAATFASFAGLLVVGLISPQQGSLSPAWAWVARVTITLLVLFPWLLFRFAGGFHCPSTWFRRVALLLTAVVVVWGWFLPGLGGPAGQAPAPVVVAYIWALMAQWGVLLVWVGVRLWQAGRHEPPVARKRIRLLAVAAVILAGDLLIAIVLPAAEHSGLTVFTQFLALASGILFYAGLVPPRWLRSIWRRSTDSIWEQAVHGVVSAADLPTLRAVLLPAAVALVGGSRATIITPDARYDLLGGNVVQAAHRPGEDDENSLVDGAQVSAAVGGDTLVVWASPFAVFFGEEERRLLEVLGGFADLAAQRLELSQQVVQAADRELRDTQATSDAVLDSAGEAIITFDDDGRVVSANPAAERLFLEPDSRLKGHSLDDLFPEAAPALAAAREAGGQDSRQDGAAETSVRLQASARTAAGHDVPVEITLTEVALAGHRLQICVARDVSERQLAAEQLAQRAEDLARSNAELQQFAYVASHDLQEPLRKVTAYVNVLATDYVDQLDDQAREYMHFVTDGAQRMRSLIEDLLAVSRVRVDRMQVEDCDTGAIVTAILEDFDVAIAEAGATVTVGALPVVPGDATHLRQALQNLISNALKYRGEAPLTIDIRAETEPNGWLFTLQDNGIGFKQEYAEQIFGMFQRLVSRRKYDGTGIGLAIVAKAIQNHGGQIWATSQPGGPTTFSFRLPATVPARPPTTAVPPHIPTTTPVPVIADGGQLTSELVTTGAHR
jgi:PAS domain S-box-containing protein